jgi:hypothetical protein
LLAAHTFARLSCEGYGRYEKHQQERPADQYSLAHDSGSLISVPGRTRVGVSSGNWTIKHTDFRLVQLPELTPIRSFTFLHSLGQKRTVKAGRIGGQRGETPSIRRASTLRLRTCASVLRDRRAAADTSTPGKAPGRLVAREFGFAAQRVDHVASLCLSDR